jgi:hypothetical protein
VLTVHSHLAGLDRDYRYRAPEIAAPATPAQPA